VRLAAKSWPVIALLLLSTPLARAQEGPDPCDLTLVPIDLPSELRPDGSSGPQAGDPAVCERRFRAETPGPSGLSSVRSMAIVTPSDRQAAADLADYRAMLLGGGWAEGPGQPLGDAAALFSGNDPAGGTYSAQLVFRRSRVVAVIEATGPALAGSPGIVPNLAKVLDDRVSLDLGIGVANPVRRGSVWPAVAAPTVVGDANLEAAPLLGESLQLGGFSGLVSLDREGTRFVAVTDRGPVSELASGDGRLMVMPLPAYTPSIVKLRLQDGQLRVAERIGLRLPAGFGNPRTGTAFVTGLPNGDADAAAFDRTGRHRWGNDPDGLDPSGIALDPRDGSYWISEEYGPSILHVAADGTILLRLMPSGLAADAPGENVRTILPAELARRRWGHGFAGLAVSPDGGRLVAIMESALANPDGPAGEASRIVRLVSLDLTAGEPRLDGLFLYLTQPYEQAGAAEQAAVKVGDVVALGPNRVLVAERDSADDSGYRTVFSVDLEPATNLLGQWDSAGPSPEQLGEHELYRRGVRWAAKSPLVNLADLGWRLAALKGLALVDESTIAVVNDNNFGFAGFDGSGALQPNGVPTRLTIVHLPGTLN
jgi:hypothetical protein